MTAAFLAASAITPSLLLVWYFHARDVYREPARVLWTTFALGMAAVVPVLIVAWPVYQFGQSIENALAHGFVLAFGSAAIPEELFKFAVLWWYSMRHSAFDEPMDGIVYGATASLGFATLENILYVSEGGSSVAIMRALTAVPGHAFLGAIMGYFAGRAHSAPPAERKALLFRALAIPTLLHGAYDFPLLAAAKLEEPETSAIVPILLLMLLVPIVLCIELLGTLRVVRQVRMAQLESASQTSEPASTTPSALVAPASRETTETAIIPRDESPRQGAVASWFLTLLGGLLASGGGLLLLGVALALVLDESDPEELSEILLGSMLIGVLPAVIGCALFLKGVRRLNRA